MQQRTARVEMLITSLLNYARVGHTKTEPETMNPADLVKEIVRSIVPPPGFHVRFQGEAPVIVTQRRRWITCCGI